MTAALRALLIFLAIVGFFLVGAPLQWLVARRAPAHAHRIPLAFCRSLLWLAKVRLTVTGELVTGRPVLASANHVSWLDIPALGAITPFCFLAKGDIAGWPIISAFAGVQGTVFVDRRRRRSIPQANRQIAERLLEARPVLLFPEGTTVGGTEPGAFRSSHFAAGRDFLALAGDAAPLAVQPVAIAYSADRAAWVGDDDLLSHLWRTLRAPPLHCRVSFGAPIAYAAGADRKAIARQARDAIVALLHAARSELEAARAEPEAARREVEAAGRAASGLLAGVEAPAPSARSL